MAAAFSIQRCASPCLFPVECFCKYRMNLFWMEIGGQMFVSTPCRNLSFYFGRFVVLKKLRQDRFLLINGAKINGDIHAFHSIDVNQDDLISEDFEILLGANHNRTNILDDIYFFIFQWLLSNASFVLSWLPIPDSIFSEKSIFSSLRPCWITLASPQALAICNPSSQCRFCAADGINNFSPGWSLPNGNTLKTKPFKNSSLEFQRQSVQTDSFWYWKDNEELSHRNIFGIPSAMRLMHRLDLNFFIV